MIPKGIVFLTIFSLSILPETLFATSLSLKPPLPLSKKGDGHLVFYHYHHDELLEIHYRDAENQYIPSALQKINYLMRSVDGKIFPIDVRLVEIIDLIQDHFGADTVEIISGYRSPEYNKKLKSMGRKVLDESLHIKGVAADIHLDEVDEKSIRDFAISLKQGGVGYYPNNHFVHVDLGPVKTWAQPKEERKLIGLQENNKGPCQLITGKNYYRHGKNRYLRIKIEGPEVCQKISETTFEHFHRGKWISLMQKSSLKATSRSFRKLPLPKLPPGKFRLNAVTSNENPPSLSNEFYLKSR